MFSSLSKKSVGALALFWSGSALAAGQCFAPSDPVRLTPDQQRAVVLNIRDNPDVFQSDFSLMRTLKNILGTVPGGDPATVTDDAAKDAGAREVRIDVLPGSGLPATLERMGYKLRREADGTRILPVAVTQEFVQSSSGALTAAEGSSRPVSMVTHSAGISPVEVWTFMLP